jgi:hypothetical protein
MTAMESAKKETKIKLWDLFRKRNTLETPAKELDRWREVYMNISIYTSIVATSHPGPEGFLQTRFAMAGCMCAGQNIVELWRRI